MPGDYKFVVLLYCNHDMHDCIYLYKLKGKETKTLNLKWSD